MPELPEVETTRLGIAPWTVGRRMEQVEVRQPKLRWPVPFELLGLLEGDTLHALRRRSKYLVFEFSGGQMLVHLGMSGSLRVVHEESEVGKHDHIDWRFSGGSIVRFTDPRRFGAVLWHPAGSGAHHPLLAKLGPEPLSQEFVVEDFLADLKRTRRPVKQAIMDNQIVVGVGNIYANESLFLAGIKPTLSAATLSKARVHRLYAAIQQVLLAALQQGGTTLKDFVGGDGKPGYFSQSLNVYGRNGEPCYRCGRLIKMSMLGQRATYHCGMCQR